VAADLRLWAVDGSASDGAWREAADLARPGDLVVLTKNDLPKGSDAQAVLQSGADLLSVSVKSDEEIRVLRDWLEGRVVSANAGAEFPAVTRERHRTLLSEAEQHLMRSAVALGGGSDLAAEDVRLAARALERISGRVDPEEILGRVFAQFCIGK
jgi:tRNA modification GTPase